MIFCFSDHIDLIKEIKKDILIRPRVVIFNIGRLSDVQSEYLVQQSIVYTNVFQYFEWPILELFPT